MRKTLALVFSILFVLFAVLQYNDPDPEIWVPIYLFAAAACGMAYFGVGRLWFYLAMTAVYLVAAYLTWPPQYEGFLLNEMGMKTINVELARESGGLALCAVAMGLLAWSVRRSPAAA